MLRWLGFAAQLACKELITHTSVSARVVMVLAGGVGQIRVLPVPEIYVDRVRDGDPIGGGGQEHEPGI